MVCQSTQLRKQTCFKSPLKLKTNAPYGRGLEEDSSPDVGEMEGVGIAEACISGNENWLLIKGISDFGNSEQMVQSDIETAAENAAEVLVSILENVQA